MLDEAAHKVTGEPTVRHLPGRVCQATKSRHQQIRDGQMQYQKVDVAVRRSFAMAVIQRDDDGDIEEETQNGQNKQYQYLNVAVVFFQYGLICIQQRGVTAVQTVDRMVINQ